MGIHVFERMHLRLPEVVLTSLTLKGFLQITKQGYLVKGPIERRP